MEWNNPYLTVYTKDVYTPPSITGTSWPLNKNSLNRRPLPIMEVQATYS